MKTPVGPYGYGARNDRGDRLIHFAQGQKLKITNSIFKKNQVVSGPGVHSTESAKTKSTPS